MEFEKVREEHILQGIKDYEEKGLPKEFGPSSTYDLVFEGKNYPPKAIMAFANFHASGRKIEAYFKGGKGTDCFNAFEREGFDIKLKKDPLLELISDYKAYIAKSKMEDEVYKWELVSQFKGRPDVNAPDFALEYKEVKFGNLIYAMAGGVGNHICRENSEEFRELFVVLCNEKVPLNDRVAAFNEDSLKLYKTLNGEHGHHQDERTISAYLTFHNPEKYTFYKSTFYKAFCKLMDVKPAGRNEKYGHYLDLLHQFIDKYIKPDTELISTVKGFIPEYYDGVNHLLLAQDILFTMLDRKIKADKVNYKDRFTSWLEGENQEGSNKSASYLRAMDLLQDKVEFTIYEISDQEELELLYTDLIQNQRNTDGIYFNEKAPSYGNNGYYSAAIKAYIDFHSYLRQLSGSDEFVKFIEQYDSNDLLKFIDFAKEIIAKHQLKIGDERLTFNYYDDRLVISVGQRYCLGLFSKDKGRKFSVLSKDPITAKTEAFDGEENKAFLNYLQEWTITDEEKNNIHEAITNELKRTNRSGYRKHNKIDFEKYIYTSNVKNMMPINRILFGPPGTGKTYKLKAEFFDRYTTKETSISKEQHIESVIRECSWWQVIGLALMDLKKAKVSDISLHPLVVIKTQLSNSNTVRPTIWGQLQSHTIEECKFVNVKSKQQPFIFNKTEDSFWEILEDETKEQHPELYDVLESINNFNPNPDKEIKRYVFTTFHQSYSYEDFIEGIKPIMPKGDGEVVDSVGYQIESGVFKELCQRASNDPNNQYAIFIDEINRGNVSAIFGELITLIEIDKRTNGKNPMSVTLPYSKKTFGVPSNLDIIGTMNTADRSVEGLDTALRRRFTFEEMLPNPSLLTETIEGISLEKLLTTINERIEVLVDRDHTIGHAFFINDTSLDHLRNTFANKVIPLLQEYFYGDYSKMEMVIGSTFFDIKDTNKVKFAVKSESFDPEGKVYHIKNISSKEILSDQDLKSAFHLLLNSED